MAMTEARAKQSRRPPKQRQIRAQAEADDDRSTISEPLTEIKQHEPQRPGQGTQNRDGQKDALFRGPKCGHNQCEDEY